MTPKTAAQDASPLVPDRGGLKAVREAAMGCQACPLWRTGTQTVFGAGPARADVMLIGEQPGDREDLEGKPFVGPAGGVLNKALAEAGIDPKQTYVTNAVKHFKWKPPASAASIKRRRSWRSRRAGPGWRQSSTE